MARNLPARTVKNGLKTGENGGVSRDARGRFVAGNPGGGRPANPFARYQAELRRVVLAEVSPADLRAVVRRVLRIAKRGHLPAVELLLKWTLGAPPAPVDPDRLDEHELDVRRKRPTLIDQLSLADEQADRTPAAEDPADEDLDDLELSPPPLQALLSWTLRELAEAQTRPAMPPALDPLMGWQAFVEHHVAFDPMAAVDVDQLFVTYARWATSHGELLVTEGQMLAWLADHGATVRTGTLTGIRTLVGVMVVA